MGNASSPAPPLPPPRPALALLLIGLTLPVTGCILEPFDLDLESCGVTCGDGPLFLLDQLSFVLETEEGLDGFDIDDLPEDCGVADGVSSEGAVGIDNQFGSVLDVLPPLVGAVLPEAIDDSLRSGDMMVVFEVVGLPDLNTDGAAALVLREGDHNVLVSSQGAPLAGQTVDLAAENVLLGIADEGSVSAGVFSARRFETELRLKFLLESLELTMMRGRLRMEADDNGVALIFGGVVPLDVVMGIIGRLGGDDTELRETLESLVPLMVDARTRPGGACDGISGALRAHAVPVHLY